MAVLSCRPAPTARMTWAATYSNGTNEQLRSVSGFAWRVVGRRSSSTWPPPRGATADGRETTSRFPCCKCDVPEPGSLALLLAGALRSESGDYAGKPDATARCAAVVNYWPRAPPHRNAPSQLRKERRRYIASAAPFDCDVLARRGRLSDQLLGYNRKTALRQRKEESGNE